MISYGALLHYCTFGLPANSFTKSAFLYGWDDLARQVDTLVDSSATPLLVVGMDKYRIASGLAFYLNKEDRLEQEKSDVNETTGRQLFGNDALMYNFWFPPEHASARDILVISEDRNQLEPVNFSNHYRQLGDIEEINITKRGKNAGHFFYRKLTAYTANAHAHIAGLAMPTTNQPDMTHHT
jgi:dolichol-phosphate mannosyltransferase